MSVVIHDAEVRGVSERAYPQYSGGHRMRVESAFGAAAAWG